MDEVHVHTLHPDEILRIGLTAGCVADVVVEDLDAIRAAHGARTIVLPNDRNVILAAYQAALLCEGVTVIPTENVAQGMAALVAFEAGRDGDEVVERMSAAAKASRCVEVTRAVRGSRGPARTPRWRSARVASRTIPSSSRVE